MRARMRDDLTVAMKARDRVAVAAIRSVLAAIENAEAQPVDDAAVAGATPGVGSTERSRRSLTEADERSVVEREIRDRVEAAAAYEQMDRPDLAEPLRREADVLARYCTPAG